MKGVVPLVRILFLNDEINLDFTEEEVELFKVMWKAGISLQDMAERLNRPQVEIVLLIIDLNYHDEIGPRKIGVFGI